MFKKKTKETTKVEQKETIAEPFILDEKIKQLLWDKKEQVFLGSENEIHSSRKTISLGPLTIPTFGSPEFFFLTHSLIHTAPDEWHVIENTKKGEGGFGVVKPSKWKIKVKGPHSAEFIPTDDIVKFQPLSGNEEERKETRNRVLLEARYQNAQGVKVYNPVETKEGIIIVAENCGISLDKLIPTKSTDKLIPAKSTEIPTISTFDEWLAITRGICNELLYLQKNDIVHRDLKPANICRIQRGIDKEGKPLYQIIFIDFGLAAKTEGTRNLIRGGTPLFMAPELVDGNPTSVASDTYATAGILYEIGGADNFLQFKIAAHQKNGNMNDLIKAPFCDEKLFSKFIIPKDVDDVLLNDVAAFLMAMQDPNPIKRPTPEILTKFFTMIDVRRAAFVLGETELKAAFGELFEFCKVIGLNQKDNKNAQAFFTPVNVLFDLMVDAQHNLNHEGHYKIVQEMIKMNEMADQKYFLMAAFPTLVQLKVEMQKLRFEFEEFKNILEEMITLIGRLPEDNREVKWLQENLSKAETPIQMLTIIQEFGKKHSSESEFLSWINLSKIFGKGENPAMQKLYKKFAKLDETINKDHLATTVRQLKTINRFIAEVTPNLSNERVLTPKKHTGT